MRPAADEAAEFYRGYIDRVPDRDIVTTLTEQGETIWTAVAALGDGDADRRYAPGKWTIKEVLGHVVDAERLFAFRAFAFARGEPAALPSYDQDARGALAGHGRRPLADLLAEAAAVRAATLALLRSFDGDAWARRGTASGCSFSVRALAWIIAGHELHHRDVLRERYGVA